MKKIIILLTLQYNVLLTTGPSSSVISFADSVASFGKEFANGIHSMGGYVPEGYIYNFQVANGIQNSVTVKTKQMKEIMGAQFDGETLQEITLQPGNGTSNEFLQTKLYFEIECEGSSGTFFSEQHYTLGVKDDKTVFTYHLYQDDQGNPQGELLGSGYGYCNQFSGVIYNNTSQPVSCAVPFGTSTCAISLEPYSFNYLQDYASITMRSNSSSTQTNSLQCATTNGTTYSVAIGSSGLGTVENSSGSSSSAGNTTVNALPYNYVITNQGAFESGLGPGNFSQPTQGAMRSITPMACYFWNQPTAQSQTNYPAALLVPIQVPWESVWLLYTGPGINPTNNTVITPLIGQLLPNQSTEVFLLRPTIQQYLAHVYIFRLNTTDNTKAIAFLQSVANGNLKIPQFSVQDALLPSNASANKVSYANLLSHQLPNNFGLMVDSNGTQGYLLLEDTFTPFASPMAGPFYYSIPTPNYDLSQMLTTFQFLQNSGGTKKLEAIAKSLQQAIPTWVQDFMQNPQSAQKAISDFIIANGSPNCLVKRSDGSITLNAHGNMAVDALIYGPASISQLPLCYLPGQYLSTNPSGDYLSTDTSTPWPTSNVPIQVAQ